MYIKVLFLIIRRCIAPIFSKLHTVVLMLHDVILTKDIDKPSVKSEFIKYLDIIICKMMFVEYKFIL